MMYALSPLLVMAAIGTGAGLLGGGATVGITVACALLGLWAIYGLESTINGGSIGRDPVWFPLDCWLEEASWSIPGGMRIKEQIVSGWVTESKSGFIGSLSHEEIREQGLYQEAVREVFRPPILFWAFSLVYLAMGAGLGYALVVLWQLACWIVS